MIKIFFSARPFFVHFSYRALGGPPEELIDYTEQILCSHIYFNHMTGLVHVLPTDGYTASRKH